MDLQRVLMVGAASFAVAAGLVVAISAPASAAGAYGHWRCTVTGSDRAETIISTAPDAFICAGGGNDVITVSGVNSTVWGDDGDDVITSTAGVYKTLSTHLYGNAGADVIKGGAGADWIEGGAGNDEIHGGQGDDSLKGDGFPASTSTDVGDDVIYGDDGNDAIEGGPGNDVLYSGNNRSVDQASGGPGNDALIGNSSSVAADWFSGDAGNDVIIPATLRLSPLGNHAKGGDGNDVIITLNRVNDYYNPGGGVAVSSPLNPCKLNLTSTKNFSQTCTLPWSTSLPAGLSRVFTVNVTYDSKNNAQLGGDLGGGLMSLSVTSWRDLLRGRNGAVSSDVTIVDSPVNASAIADVEFG